MKQFEDFRTALEALCVEHGMRITGSRDYDDYSTYLEVATEAEPAGCEIEFVDCLPPTPEEIAERAREEAFQDEQHRLRRLENEKYEREREAWMASPEFAALSAENRRQANLSREYNMRVSTDPTDPAFIDARPRRVWCNNVEVLGWLVADEFRRCVITAAGVMNGAVLIERLAEPGAEVVAPPPECSASLAGMLVKVEEAAPEVPAPTFAVPTVPVKAAAMSAKRKRGKK